MGAVANHAQAHPARPVGFGIKRQTGRPDGIPGLLSPANGGLEKISYSSIGVRAMAKIEKSISINAPVEKVFEFMSKPENLPEIWPSLQEVRNVQSLPNGSYCYDWTYKMAGVRFDGKAEWTEFVKNQRIVDKNESGIPSTFIWTYRAEDGGTRVSVSVDYTIPGAVLGKLAEPIIHKMNEHEAETVLANLKARMEG
jgi:uncharacterized membrane protein